MNDNIKEAAVYCTTTVVLLAIVIGSIMYGCTLNAAFKTKAIQAGYIQTEQLNSMGLKWVKAINSSTNALQSATSN